MALKPLRPIDNPEMFLSALDPHVERIRLAAMFEMEAVWQGMAASEFSDLLEVMQDWIEGPVQKGLIQRIGVIEGFLGPMSDAEIDNMRMQAQAQYKGLMPCMITNLRLAAEPNKEVRVGRDEVKSVKKMVDDIITRCFVSIPKAFDTLDEMIAMGESAILLPAPTT
ncbi:hypothetical protein ACEUZ9_004105 [Paracoccus litorisediminis]|uniref:hypothetical protein n=1 Tax=Paracoccus litorisediminis TaxID=2006130 RepID=UPI00372E8F85